MVKKSKQKKKSEEKVDLELRPHHVLGYIGHEAQPELYSLSDEKYISNFREGKRKQAEESARQSGRSEEYIKKSGEYAYNFHSDELILHARDSVKRISDDPNTKFKYISNLDSICEGCDKKEECHDEKHDSYKIVQQADADAHNWMSELEHGKIYTGHDLKKLVKKYKNLSKEHK
ncbi:hypothetical protein CEE44_01750 [Candidatus Woesearchaeota archaeon B3_Woes]|nr:MAG: hypothetical protein CEE44_01750 [Candidatus Woesearchaeota archaeon B3_Woes]